MKLVLNLNDKRVYYEINYSSSGNGVATSGNTKSSPRVFGSLEPQQNDHMR